MKAEVKKRQGGRFDRQAWLWQRDVGADDGEDVVVFAAPTVPGGEPAVKDVLLIALALNRLSTKD